MKRLHAYWNKLLASLLETLFPSGFNEYSIKVLDSMHKSCSHLPLNVNNFVDSRSNHFLKVKTDN